MLSHNEIISSAFLQIISYLLRRKKVSLRQIALGAKLSYNSCYKFALRLEKSGVLEIERKSGVNYCSLQNNSTTCLLAGYVSLLEAEAYLSNHLIIKKIIGEMLLKFNYLDCLAIYGSQVKGTANEKSDIDLFCVTDSHKEFKSFAYHLSLKYSKEIQVIVANRTEFREMLAENKVNIGTEVRDTGIILSGYEFYWKMVLERK